MREGDNHSVTNPLPAMFDALKKERDDLKSKLEAAGKSNRHMFSELKNEQAIASNLRTERDRLKYQLSTVEQERDALKGVSRVAELERMLWQCHVASGHESHSEGNLIHDVPYAVDAVRDLRKDYDTACEDVSAMDVKLAALTEENARHTETAAKSLEYIERLLKEIAVKDGLIRLMIEDNLARDGRITALENAD